MKKIVFTHKSLKNFKIALENILLPKDIQDANIVFSQMFQKTSYSDIFNMVYISATQNGGHWTGAGMRTITYQSMENVLNTKK